MTPQKKNIRRRWDVNLTGGQIDKILSRYLKDTLRPLAVTTLLDKAAALFLAELISNNRKKQSARYFQSIRNLSDGLLASDAETKINYLNEAKLDRGKWLRLFNEFKKTTTGYDSLYRAWLMEVNPWRKSVLAAQIRIVADSVGANPNDLFMAVRQFKAALGRLELFKEDLVYQYQSIASWMCGRWAASQQTYSYPDMVQTAMSAVDDAINTYSASQGAVTSHVKSKILYALTTSSVLVGVAYDIPPSERRQVACGLSGTRNLAISLEAPVSANADVSFKDLLAEQPVEETSEDDDLLSKIPKLVKALDKTGVFRLMSGISEVF